MITCFVKYQINPDKLDDFKVYAKIWVELVEKYGGTHQGYFLLDNELDSKLSTNFSFPFGKTGDKNTAMALFSFPDIDTYEKYREDVKIDPQCAEATKIATDSNCFTSYERYFLKPI